ncbi:MAG TPA: alpha/beta hydrolase [Ktedonobacterales bacterium]|nr:alpha/beta hydrolase [Ktedonobacterales bacterium]
MATDFIPHSTPPMIERVVIGPDSIPALVVQPQGALSGHRLPAVLIQHGYGAEKSDLLPLASELVSRGFVTLLPDAWGHGERFPASGPNWMTQISADYFMEVVRHTVGDMRLAFDYLRAIPSVDAESALVGGFSMGAIAALVFGTEDERVAGIISASGSPLPDLLPVRLFGSAAPSAATEEWAHAHDAAARISALAPKPLLIQHGQADDMVPVTGALRLYEAAQPLYEARPDHLKLMLYPHTHLVTEQEIRDAVNWAARLFSPNGASPSGADDSPRDD